MNLGSSLVYRSAGMSLLATKAFQRLFWLPGRTKMRKFAFFDRIFKYPANLGSNSLDKDAEKFLLAPKVL